MAVVAADETCAGPGADVWAEFVVHPELAIGGVKEDRVPAGDGGLADEQVRGRPVTGSAARCPNSGVRSALRSAAEPGRQEIAVAEFDDGGGVGGGKGCGGEDEFLGTLRC